MMLRPVGTEFDLVSFSFENTSSDTTTFTVIRYRVDGNEHGREQVTPVEIIKYRSPVWLMWGGRYLPVPHDDILPLLDEGWRAMASAAKRNFPGVDCAVRVEPRSAAEAATRAVLMAG